MGQRNMTRASQMHDLEMDQQVQGHLIPEPFILLRNITDFSHPNIHGVAPASGNASNLELRHFPEHHDGPVLYGTQYNGLQHHHHPVINLDFATAAAASNFYGSYMVPSSGSRMFPLPLNHGASDNIPSSSNHGINGVGVDENGRNNHFMDENGRNNHFMDGFRGSCKRKNAEGIPGHVQHANGLPSSSSSSSGNPSNMRLHHQEEHLESGAAVPEAELIQPEYRENSIMPNLEGPRSVRSRPNAIGLQLNSALPHNHNHLVQRNYMSQSFQPVHEAWVDQQLGGNNGDGGASTWNSAPVLPYAQASSANGEIGNIDRQGYQETPSGRNSTILLHPSSMHHHQHYHHPLIPIQGMQVQNLSYHSQVPTSSFRHPTSNALHPGIMNPRQDGVDSIPRHQRSYPPTGLGMYRSHRRGVSQATFDDSNRQRLRLRFLPGEEVAILVPGFVDVSNFVDHHQDMRMDIDDMTYEELLALGERIGHVNTGLSEETIRRRLKTRNHISSAAYINLIGPVDMEQESDTCIICQSEYENREKIGILDCGHEYHAECIKKWLLVKNVCPICKNSALVESNGCING